MDNKKQVHQGEILMLLSRRSRLDGAEIAQRMGISRNYLSDIYRRESLSNKIRLSAASVFGVDIDIFDTGLGYELPSSREERVGEPDEAYNNLIAENARLREENAKIAEDLLRERAANEDLRKTLLLIAGKSVTV